MGSNKVDHKLKLFMRNNFDFDGLKEAGFYNGIKRNDYRAQAARVCYFFSLDSIYEYNSTPIKAHISYADGHGKDKPFVETFGRDSNIIKAEINLMHINSDN